MDDGSSARRYANGSARKRTSQIGQLIGKLSGRWCLGLVLVVAAAGLAGCVAYPVDPAPAYYTPAPYYGPAYVYGPHYYYGPRYYHPYYGGCRGRCW